MGKLIDRKSKLSFETSDEIRERGKYRALIVGAHPTHVELRLKGMRQGISISWSGVYNLAMQREVLRRKAEKKAARKAKKEAI